LYIQRQDIINCVKSKELSFEDKCFRLYAYQREYNPIYRQFLDVIGKLSVEPSSVESIPFCPIGLYKSREIKTGEWNAEQLFLSSGTTQMTRSKHHIRSVEEYLQNAADIWHDHFGPLSDYTFLSLLPNYHANPSSSLLKMVEYFMHHSADGQERYYLDDHNALHTYIESEKRSEKKLVLFGVSFALLDYVDQLQHQQVNNLTVIETGGMKKFKKELTRQELHGTLAAAFDGATICSEYGMTECLSQLYAVGSGHFGLHDMMQVVITDPTDPFTAVSDGTKGRINIIDLANYDTLSFMATDDLGSLDDQGMLEVIGRIDSTDLRGCNYLI